MPVQIEKLQNGNYVWRVKVCGEWSADTEEFQTLDDAMKDLFDSSANNALFFDAPYDLDNIERVGF